MQQFNHNALSFANKHISNICMYVTWCTPTHNSRKLQFFSENDQISKYFYGINCGNIDIKTLNAFMLVNTDGMLDWNVLTLLSIAIFLRRVLFILQISLFLY